MIELFKSKSLKELFETGRTARLDARMHHRIIRRLDALKEAKRAEDMNLPGFNFHPLQGFKPTRYSVHVNGPWCITFEFEGEHATQVDYEQYH
jgi:proteic killer suppression protein